MESPTTIKNPIKFKCGLYLEDGLPGLVAVIIKSPLLKLPPWSGKAIWKGNNTTLLEPGSKLLVLGMVIQPLIGNPCNGYINPYYWVDDHSLLYGNNGSLDPGTLKGTY